MANHCFYEKCEKCGEDSCVLGCNVRCRCEVEYENKQREQRLIDAAKKVLEHHDRSLYK